MEIRNFAIIAHIDHGKSTLADRLLEKTGTVKPGSGEQLLDTMELEQERGITIKLNPARMFSDYQGQTYQLNLIDTPGHVDFGYEVSRSLAAVEGVLLLVDASQGIQAQTLTNYHLAKSLGLTIIPVVNKIDLPTADPLAVGQQLVKLLGCRADDICFVSGKTGEGVEGLLETIINRIPNPKVTDNQVKALIFDSFFDKFLGVVAYVKIMGGSIRKGDRLAAVATKAQFAAEQVGYLQLERRPVNQLEAGEIGYIATGLKTLTDCRVGDTIVLAGSQTAALAGYRTPQPMVYASIFPDSGQERLLTTALEKLKLNDAALTFEPIRSQALGLGFTIGCLGLLHLEIVKERLEREFDLTVLVTTPTVAYQEEDGISTEPWVDLEIIAPTHYYGPVSDLAAQHRCKFITATYLGDRAISQFEAPLAEVIVDFYDQLKSVTAGYASMDYQLKDYRPVDLVTVDLLVAGEKIDALSLKIIRVKAERYGRNIVERLKELIPRQNFEVTLQAAIGGKIIARADIPALRKDVTAKLYGGDVTRKRKLLEKQKKGKKKMRMLGRVEVPSEVFVQLLKKN